MSFAVALGVIASLANVLALGGVMSTHCRVPMSKPNVPFGPENATTWSIQECAVATPAPGMPTGGVAAFSAALVVWTNAPWSFLEKIHAMPESSTSMPVIGAVAVPVLHVTGESAE